MGVTYRTLLRESQISWRALLSTELPLAITEAPRPGILRAMSAQKSVDDIVAANWDSLVFDIGQDPLRRVPMMGPGRGTKAHVGDLLAEVETAAELLNRLGS